MTTLEEIAPAFVEMAHRIVWASAATVDRRNRPWSRVLHPLWTWDGSTLTGIVATDPGSPKRAHVDHSPFVSFTYWVPSHDTCTAQCAVEWDLSDEGRRAGWEALATAPAPVGYDPSVIPAWTEPTAEAFGILRLRPWRLHLMDGSIMLQGTGRAMSWTADA